MMTDLLGSFAERTDSERARLLQEHSSLTLKLFAAFCLDLKEGKALELAQLSQHVNAAQMLCNFASRQNRTVLSEKITEHSRKRSLLRPSENKEVSAEPEPVLGRKVELKRRPTAVPAAAGADAAPSLDASLGLGLDESLGQSPAAAPSVNPFKVSLALPPSLLQRRAANSTVTTAKKTRADLFDSLPRQD